MSIDKPSKEGDEIEIDSANESLLTEEKKVNDIGVACVRPFLVKKKIIAGPSQTSHRRTFSDFLRAGFREEPLSRETNRSYRMTVPQP